LNTCASLLASAAARCTATAWKMAMQVQKANYMLWFHETKSVTAVQRWFCWEFGLNPPTRSSIYVCYKQFTQSGCLCKGKSSGRLHISEATVDRMWQVFVRSLWKSTRCASQELVIPEPVVWKIVRKCLQLKCCYKFQILQQHCQGDGLVEADQQCGPVGPWI
jgi:hypothetical protein